MSSSSSPDSSSFISLDYVFTNLFIYLCLYVYEHINASVFGGQKRVSGSSELDLTVILSLSMWGLETAGPLQEGASILSCLLRYLFSHFIHTVIKNSWIFYFCLFLMVYPMVTWIREMGLWKETEWIPPFMQFLDTLSQYRTYVSLGRASSVLGTGMQLIWMSG